jgi:hypothetical protein
MHFLVHFLVHVGFLFIRSPGTDTISKQIAFRQLMIGIFAKNLLNTPVNTYTITNPDFSDGMSSDLLYVPMSPEPSKFPPIIVELQRTVDKNFIVPAIRYYLNVHSSFKVFPAMLIICIEKLSPASYGNSFTQYDEKPFLFKFNCEHWAKDCYLMSSNTITPFVDNEETDLNPLVALAHFFISQQSCLINVERWIQSLYKYARDIVEGITTEKETTLAVL